MRGKLHDILIYIAALALVSCTEMHEPILHGGGLVKFVPECFSELDSVAAYRMENCYVYSWTPDLFFGESDEYRVLLRRPDAKRELYFVEESEPEKFTYGPHEALWSTNPYAANIYDGSIIYTESLNDSISAQPDFTYAEADSIYVSEHIHDYVTGESGYVQVFRGILLQRSFRYIVQVTLVNNRGRVVKAGSFLAGGFARYYDIADGYNRGTTAHAFGTRLKNDVICGSFISFGIPEVDTYEFRNNYRNDSRKYYKNGIYVLVQLIYKNGSRIIRYDISDQVCLQPTGGLILLRIDIDEHSEPATPDIMDPFNVFVDDYENTDEYYNSF